MKKYSQDLKFKLYNYNLNVLGIINKIHYFMSCRWAKSDGLLTQTWLPWHDLFRSHLWNVCREYFRYHSFVGNLFISVYIFLFCNVGWNTWLLNCEYTRKYNIFEIIKIDSLKFLDSGTNNRLLSLNLILITFQCCCYHYYLLIYM